MAGNKEQLIIEAVQTVFSDATKVSRIGSDKRLNSETFKVEFSDKTPVVIKLLRVTRYVKPEELEQEKNAHEAIKSSGRDIPVGELLSFGTLKVGSMSMPYLVFPYIDGADLARCISKSGAFSEQEVHKFVDFGVRVINDLRELGIIHQDIKPGNIIKSSDGYMVIDLGIAKFINFSRPELAKPQGPARYLSPEKTRLALHKAPKNERQLTFASDLYSLGVVAFELLCGHGFGRTWDVSQRHTYSDKIRSGEVLDIKDEALREKLAALLEISVASRTIKSSALFNIPINAHSYARQYWIYGPSQKPMKTFLKDHPDVSLGMVIPSKKCSDSTKKFITSMKDKGVSIMVDPLTYRMQFNSDNHEDPLARLPYYLDRIDEHFITDPIKIGDFTESVIKHQIEFEPNYYIAPYFYAEKPSDSLLDLSFNTYKMADKILKRENHNEPLAFGVVISKQILTNQEYLDDLIDQLIMHSDFDYLYVQFEMPKASHLPFEDKRILAGISDFIDKISVFKALMISNIDQSVVCPFASNNFAIAINPKEPRKHDIEYFIKPRPRGVRRLSENIRNRVYISDLFSDLDIDRDISKDSFDDLNKTLNMGSDSMYSKQVGGVGGFKTTDTDLRTLHFMDSFGGQIDKIAAHPVGTEDRKKVVYDMLDHAEECFSKLDSAGIILDAQNKGSFIEVWRDTLT
ncbi:MAG: serine/threonine protein kinase [Candidatus Saccharibacteria bacterium]|nr:serine/threonine protein kinase [Candidatus Saccharibacteria bacterium]